MRLDKLVIYSTTCVKGFASFIRRGRLLSECAHLLVGSVAVCGMMMKCCERNAAVSGPNRLRAVCMRTCNRSAKRGLKQMAEKTSHIAMLNRLVWVLWSLFQSLGEKHSNDLKEYMSLRFWRRWNSSGSELSVLQRGSAFRVRVLS